MAIITDEEFDGTKLDELIELVERDSVPTNEFTIEKTDPMVLLGKLNTIEAYLESLRGLITRTDQNAEIAVNKALEAIATATNALTSSNTALSTANTAISNVNTALSQVLYAINIAQNAEYTATQADTNATTALSTANSAAETASQAQIKAETADANATTALSTANSANTKAEQAITTANSANSTANLADHKADNALSTASTASSTASEASSQAGTATSIANSANTKAEQAIATANEALAQVVEGGGTKVYVGGVLQTTFDADTKANQSQVTNIATLTNANTSSISNINAKNTEQDGRLGSLGTMIDDIDEELATANQSISNLSTSLNNVWSKIYPIGAIYISTINTSPALLFGGTWSQLDAGYALWTATSGTGGETISAGLPNITGTSYAGIQTPNTGGKPSAHNNETGAFYWNAASTQKHMNWVNSGSAFAEELNIDANRINSIYGNSNTVQPPAIKVFAWKRVE